MVPRRLIAAALAVLVLSAVGCGGSSDTAQVRVTLAALARATKAKDYKTLCTRVFAHELLTKLNEVGLPCVTALSKGLGGVAAPALSVEQIKITGHTALARVRSTAAAERPSTDVIQLVKEKGGWRVSSLAAPQPPAPPSTNRAP